MRMLLEILNTQCSKVCLPKIHTLIDVLTLTGLGQIYLDHAGSALYPFSAVEDFQKDMTTGLYGNPHSESRSSKLSTEKMEDIRLRTLEFFNASPEEFDLVFVQNATAGIKVVAELLHSKTVARGYEKNEGAFKDGFWFGYHLESHTSIVGLRQLSRAGSFCFRQPLALDRIS